MLASGKEMKIAMLKIRIGSRGFPAGSGTAGFKSAVGSW
jgi:hypothetical protein